MNRKLNRAFTLVELLVVIGIIAVLVSMLLPALNKARSMAMSTQCLSNLRQLGLGCLTYTSVNKGRLPYNYIHNADNSYAMRNSAVAGLYKEGYLAKGQPVRVLRGGSTTFNVGNVFAPGTLQCPAAEQNWTTENGTVPSPGITMGMMSARWRNAPTKYRVPISGGADESAAVYSYQGTGQVYTNYAINAIDGRAEWSAFRTTPILVAVKHANDPTAVKRTFDNVFANNSVFSGELLPNPQVSLSKIRHSADTWMAFDCAGTMSGVFGAGGGGYKSPGIKATGILWRHPNISANFIYFDGHAENLRTADVDGGPLYDDVGLLAASATGVGAVGDDRLLPDH